MLMHVFTVWLGGAYRVVISSYANFHKALIENNKITSKRSDVGLPGWRKEIFAVRPGIARHILWKDAKKARQQTATFLNNEGMGRTVMEPHVLNEADKFIQFFIEPRLESGEGLDTITPLSLAATNILVNTLTGNSYDYDDPKAHDHLNLIHEEHKHNVTFAASIPFTKWIPGDPFHSAEAERNYSETFKKILSNFDNIVAKRRRELQDGCSPNLMLDHMLLQYRPELGDQERFDANVGSMIQQMYAGSTASGSYLCWALLYLSVYPHMQERLHNEIDEVIGEDSVPEYSLREKLPYADAFVLETFRHSECIHVLSPRTTESELVIDGQVLPAGVELMFNLDSVYNDPDIFDNVHEFNPERFLTGDVTKKKACIEAAFGLGRRKCIAIPLGKMEVFLILLRIMQQFSVTYEGDTKPPLINMGGINSKPYPHRIVFTRRNKEIRK
ncbi:CYP2U1 [Bugula neritina]|uniref:CYP2U1 n=1 Tax=Bugula neritina TaxID=10212 RepID=A0A7J7KCU2_BUGNE|nr:CYP2U1 [Bugula neritina]